jgi:hypothetical protein
VVTVPDLSHEVWEWIGALMVVGPCVGGLLWAWREIACEAMRCRDAEAAAEAWRAEAERLAAELEAARRQAAPLPDVMAHNYVVDRGWGAAS